MTGPPEPSVKEEAVAAWRRDVTLRAVAEAQDAVSKLWLGNGAGLITALTALGVPHDTEVHIAKWFIVCPISFAVGLVCLGVGSLCSIHREVNRLQKNRSALDVLDLKASTIRPPEEDLALIPGHPKVLLAYISGLSFVIGICIAIFAICSAFPS